MRSVARSAAALLTLLGCHSAPSLPVPVSGQPEAIQALVGSWEGTYESDNGIGSGSIEFVLRAGTDTAYGDVLMRPRGYEQAVTPEERPSGQLPQVSSTRLLTIRFVQVSGGEVSGELDRYRDPFCGCLLRTVFQGRVVGDTLRGRYRSYHEQGEPPTGGTWQVARQAGAGR